MYCNKLLGFALRLLTVDSLLSPLFFSYSLIPLWFCIVDSSYNKMQLVIIRMKCFKKRPTHRTQSKYIRSYLLFPARNSTICNSKDKTTMTILNKRVLKHAWGNKLCNNELAYHVTWNYTFQTFKLSSILRISIPMALHFPWQWFVLYMKVTYCHSKILNFCL